MATAVLDRPCKLGWARSVRLQQYYLDKSMHSILGSMKSIEIAEIVVDEKTVKQDLLSQHATRESRAPLSVCGMVACRGILTSLHSSPFARHQQTSRIVIKMPENQFKPLIEARRY